MESPRGIFPVTSLEAHENDVAIEAID